MWTGDKKVPDNWHDSWKLTSDLFDEAGVEYTFWKENNML
jgi:hypothetical protein